MRALNTFCIHIEKKGKYHEFIGNYSLTINVLHKKYLQSTHDINGKHTECLSFLFPGYLKNFLKYILTYILNFFIISVHFVSSYTQNCKGKSIIITSFYGVLYQKMYWLCQVKSIQSLITDSPGFLTPFYTCLKCKQSAMNKIYRKLTLCGHSTNLKKKTFAYELRVFDYAYPP